MKKESHCRQRGSVTIEATIALTAFLFAFMMLYCVITVCRVQTKINVAINNTAKEISQYSYIYGLTGIHDSTGNVANAALKTKEDINQFSSDVSEAFDAIQNVGDSTYQAVTTTKDELDKFSSLDSIIENINTVDTSIGNVQDAANNVTDSVNNSVTSIKTVQKDLESFAENPKDLMFGLAKIFATDSFDIAKSRLIAAPISKALCKKHLRRSPDDTAEECLRALAVVKGEDSYLDGLDFTDSLLYPEGTDEIIIIVKYKVKLFPYLPIDITYDITQSATTKGWLHGDKGFVEKVRPESGGSGSGSSGDSDATISPNPTTTPTPQPSVSASPTPQPGIGTPGMSAEEIRTKMVTKYGQGAIDIIDAAYDTSEWDLETWEYYIYLYAVSDPEPSPSPTDNPNTASKISPEDKAKIDKWKWRPSDEDYIKYKDIYDNRKYFNQETGDCIYPGTENPYTHVTDKNTYGFLNGEYDSNSKIAEGTIITRYGDNDNAKYFSPEGVPLEQRALPPKLKTLVKIKVLKDIPCSSGIIAPWFDQPGGGIQYYTNIQIKALDGTMVDATLENLVNNKYIEILH